MKLVIGLNGFGRFGLHMLKYWLDRSSTANFEIKYINDEALELQAVLDIIRNDPYIQIAKIYKIHTNGNEIAFTNPQGKIHTLHFFNESDKKISWIGEPDIFFECSGKNTNSRDCLKFLKGNTQQVVISATSWDADKTLVYGFNHKSFSENQRVVSYGSCTVNAYVPFTAFLHEKFGVLDSDVNVIHNIQEYRLREKKNHTLLRKFCTLEKSGPVLLGFLNEDNFAVNYTVVPYSGVSIIDMRFNLRSKVTKGDLLSVLDEAFTNGELKQLYSFDQTDRGPEVHKSTSYSSVLIREQVRMIGQNVYFQCYFDNENSVNRYFDLINYISSRKLDKKVMKLPTIA